jgi:hypothetical protein
MANVNTPILQASLPLPWPLQIKCTLGYQPATTGQSFTMPKYKEAASNKQCGFGIVSKVLGKVVRQKYVKQGGSAGRVFWAIGLAKAKVMAIAQILNN